MKLKPLRTIHFNWKKDYRKIRRFILGEYATVAQLVEQRIRNA